MTPIALVPRASRAGQATLRVWCGRGAAAGGTRRGLGTRWSPTGARICDEQELPNPDQKRSDDGDRKAFPAQRRVDAMNRVPQRQGFRRRIWVEVEVVVHDVGVPKIVLICGHAQQRSHTFFSHTSCESSNRDDGPRRA